MAVNPIPTRELKLSDVPDAEADWFVIASFALTYDGDPGGASPNPTMVPLIDREPTVADLRARLFLEQHLWRFRGIEPDPDSMKYIREVVDEIRLRLGGPGGPDPRD